MALYLLLFQIIRVTMQNIINPFGPLTMFPDIYGIFRNLLLKNFFLEVDMEVTQILPMKWDAYYVALLSEEYKSKKKKPIQSLWKGFQSNYKAKTTSEYSSLLYIIKNKI